MKDTELDYLFAALSSNNSICIKGQTDLLLYIIDQAILLSYEYILCTC